MDLDNTAEIAALFADEQFDRGIDLAAQVSVSYSREIPHTYAQTNPIEHLNNAIIKSNTC